MKRCSLVFSIFATCSLLSLVEARKTLTQTLPFNEHNQKTLVESSPMVLDTQFILPLTDYEKFYWRLDMSPPVLRAGWQTDQSANSKDLTFNYKAASF